MAPQSQLLHSSDTAVSKLHFWGLAVRQTQGSVFAGQQQAGESAEMCILNAFTESGVYH